MISLIAIKMKSPEAETFVRLQGFLLGNKLFFRTANSHQWQMHQVSFSLLHLHPEAVRLML